MDCLICICVKIAEYAVAPIAEYTVAPIGRQLGYLCFYKRNVDELKAQIKHLGDAQKKLQHRVDDAKRNGEEIEADVQELLTTVLEIIEDNNKFTRDEEQANTKCCTGAFPIPNLVLRHRLSRRANKKAQDIATQIKNVEKYHGIDKISHLPNPPTSVENEDYQKFNSRNQTLSEIMKALRDPNVRVLGVWGMGGVGKTMLAKEVARIAKDEGNLFSGVVFTTISQTPNIEKIQEDIRKCLGMDKNDDVGDRIKIRLAKENDILVIVDDVWENSMPVHELANIGISFVGKKGCKILVTSRDHCVLNDDMNVDKAYIFEVGVLPDNEAMDLFSKIVGDQAIRHNFQRWATEIVKECGGLPLAITTVASALKNNSNPKVWRDALYELRKPGPSDIRNMDKRVYPSIRLSYDLLQDEQAKKLFLLSGLFKEDEEIPVELLCIYGFGLKIFDGTTKLEDARNKTVKLVQTLKDHSLLLMGNDYEDGGDFVKLHDVIRDVVIYIASKDDDFRMRNFEDAVAFEEFLDTEEFKKTTAISLYDIKADGYPDTLKSPVLKLLRLTYGYIEDMVKRMFQHHFFEGLDQLLVLHLEQVSLDFKRLSLEASQASSFCLLQNLQTLRLIECDLGDISWVGELKNLKILYLSSDSITELPEEIGNLNRLLSLHLPKCRNLQVIRPYVISRLTRLEELNLAMTFKLWEDSKGAVNANLGEVKNLRHLTNLSLTVSDVNILPNNMFSEKLDKFNIQIGTDYYLFFEKNFSRMLRLKLHPDSVLEEHDFEVLLKRSEFLELSGLKSAKSIAYELDCEGFPNLEELIIEDSTEILCILNSNENKDNRAAFGKLRDIEVNQCNKMKSLFSIYIPEKLERITVQDCEMVEEIISDGREGDGDLLKISELRYLSLSNLPKLVQFKAMTKKSDEIRDGAQSIDDSVVPLFNGEVVFPRLEKLKLEGLNVGKIWNGDQLRSSESSFQNLTSVCVIKCDKLKGLIPLSLARSLIHLECLDVWSCEAVEEVVFVEESTQEANTFENISFPKLETLRLWNLPNLKRFYAPALDCFMLELCIKSCPKLGEFSTNTMPTTENESYEDLLDQADKQLLFNHKVVFPELKQLKLEWLNVGQIWNGDQLRSSGSGFQNLTRVIVTKCDKLKGLIPLFVARSLVHLECLEVHSCEAMEEIVFVEESTQEVKTFENISFPKLETLQLRNLPNLKRFYAGDCVDCSSLLELWITNCPKLGEFLTNSMPTTGNGNIEDLLDQADKQLLFNHKDLADQFKIKRLESLCLQGLPTLEQLPKTFQNVETLVIKSCRGLTSTLFHRSTAKSLSQLIKLFIYGCPNLRQVIANDNKEAHNDLDETADDIVFGQLETLTLVDLSSLEVFYSGDSVLKFPCLKELVVDDCLGMKTFSHGNIDCSMLDKIVGRNKSNHNLRFPDRYYEENNFADGYWWKHWWEGDINTTIQELWKVENDSSFTRSVISEEDTEEDT